MPYRTPLYNMRLELTKRNLHVVLHDQMGWAVRWCGGGKRATVGVHQCHATLAVAQGGRPLGSLRATRATSAKASKPRPRRPNPRA